MQSTAFALITTLVAILGFTHSTFAGPIDVNAEIKSEFKNDIPTSYSEAIKQNLETGASANAPAVGNAVVAENGVAPATFSFTERDTEQVRVVYTGYAQLLGFLPVPVSVEVAIDANGEARVALPWYRFLLSYEDTASVEESLSARVQAKTNLPAPSGVLSEADQSIIMMILQDVLPFHFTR